MQVMHQDFTEEEMLSYHIQNGELLKANKERYSELFREWWHMEGYDFKKDVWQRDRAHNEVIRTLRQEAGMIWCM